MRSRRVEKKIFALLGVDESIHVDELVEKTELNSSEVLAALCEMEMKGMVRQMPGKQFLKVLLIGNLSGRACADGKPP